MRASTRIPLLLVLLLGAAIPAPAPGSPTVPLSGAPDGGPALDPVPTGTVQGHFRTWQGSADDVPGRSAYSEGDYILTDYPFDDHGADVDGFDGRSNDPLEYYSMTEGARAATNFAGDYAYPDDPAFAGNTADIVETRVAADDDAWYLLVRLNTLIDPERVAIGGTIRVAPPDDGPAERLLIHGNEGTLEEEPIEVYADAEQNVFEARIPRSVSDPRTDRKALTLGAGLWNPNENTWLNPENASSYPPYFDLAYNGSEPLNSYWQDVNQASMMNGRLDPFIVDFGDLEPCQSCPIFKPRRYGWQNRVFRSGQDLGEGIELQTLHAQDEGGLGYKYYRPTTQPYTVYKSPYGAGGAQPLVILLHFLGGNHMSYPITSMEGIEEWADSLGAIVAMPFGRGEAGWYEGPAEKDVFEVWRDVASRDAVDRERVYIAGMSMGGFGAWRLGGLYPDQFAKAIVWSGPTRPNTIWPSPAPVMWPQANPPMCDRDDEGCGYSLTDLFGNVSSVPYLVVHGGLDELVPATGAAGWMDEFDSQGPSPYRFVLYPGRRHETSFPGTTPHLVRQWLNDLPARTKNPARVEYTIVRDLIDAAHGLSYEGAYWVSGMRLDEGASEGTITATTNGSNRVVRTGPLAGGDTVGPFLLEEKQVAFGPASAHFIDVEVAGLQTATIDTARLRWTGEEERYLTIEADDPVALRLEGAFTSGTEVDGAAFTFAEGALTLQVPAGLTNVVVRN